MNQKLSERLSEKLGSVQGKTLENEITYDFSRTQAISKSVSNLQIEMPKQQLELQRLTEQIRTLKIGIWFAFGIAFLFSILMHSIISENLEVLKTNSSPKIVETITGIATRLEEAQKTIENLKEQGDERAKSASQSMEKTLEALTAARKDLNEMKKNTEGFQDFHQTAKETIKLLTIVDQDFKRLFKEPQAAQTAESTSLVPNPNEIISSPPDEGQ